MKITHLLPALALLLTVSTASHFVTYAQSQGDRTPPGIELPDNWETLSDEERREYFQANRPEGATGERPQRGQRTEGETGERSQRGQKTGNKKARKAKNYQKFSGSLKTAKNFSDDSEINNKDAVSFLQQRGILDGYEDGSFGPQNSINRAESLKVLLESLGSDIAESTISAFSDVPADAWFAKYVSTAKANGIVDGYEDGSFRPGDTVNQVELLKLAFESFGIDLADYPITTLNADDWFAPYLQYAIDNNLLDANAVNAGEGMTREAFSEVLYRLIGQQEGL